MLEDQHGAPGADARRSAAPRASQEGSGGTGAERDIMDTLGSPAEALNRPGGGDAAEADESDPPEPAADADGDDEQEQDDGKKPSLIRRHPLWTAAIVLGVVAAAVAVYAYWLLALHPYESTDDAFVDARQYSVAPKVSGYVVDVPVTDNQHVEAGATLFQIDRRDYDVALQQAEAQVASAKASIRNFDAQIAGQQAQIGVAQAQVTQAEASLKFAQEDAARYKDLAERGAGTIQRSQSSTSTLDQQQAGLQSARGSLQAAKTQVGALEAQKAGAVANLAMGEAQVAQARLNLGYTTVVAAQSGRVVQLSGARGQFAQAGQTLTTFVPDDIWVTANYKETQITDMRPGQPVDVEIDAYPGRKITGHVDSVQPGSGTAFSLLPAQNATGNYVKVVQRIPVKIVVDQWPTDVSIGPGMSIVPRVHVR